MRYLSIIFLVLKKELKDEFRRKEGIVASFFFALISLVLFHFSFDSGVGDISQSGAGLLWLIILFAGTLFIGASFKKEEENGTFYALLLAPVDRGAIYLAKFLSNLILLTLLEVFLLFISYFFLNIPIFNSPLSICFVFLLVSIGFSSLGTLISALLINERGSAVLYPLLLYPLLIPLFMGGATLTNEAINSKDIRSDPWLPLIILFDILFLTISTLLFESAVEE